MIIRLIIYALLFALSCAIAIRFSIGYSYSDYKDYLTLLSGVSGMVFTIMGIWIAFLYPNALSRLVNPDKVAAADFSESLNDTKRLEKIVAAVLQSAMVMVFALLVTFAKVVFSKFDFYLANIIYLKSAAISGVFVATIIQIEAVLGVVFANVMFINELHNRRRDRQSDSDF